jgi:hypothetical protein
MFVLVCTLPIIFILILISVVVVFPPIFLVILSDLS